MPKKFLLYRTRLRIGPIKDSTIIICISVINILLYSECDSFRLGITGLIYIKSYLIAGILLGPKAFVHTAGVILNNGIGRIKYIALRAVILLKFDNLRFRKILFKIKNIAYVGTAEFIN